VRSYQPGVAAILVSAIPPMSPRSPKAARPNRRAFLLREAALNAKKYLLKWDLEGLQSDLRPLFLSSILGNQALTN
jgi:hypothetical protein